MQLDLAPASEVARGRGPGRARQARGPAIGSGDVRGLSRQTRLCRASILDKVDTSFAFPADRSRPRLKPAIRKDPGSRTGRTTSLCSLQVPLLPRCKKAGPLAGPGHQGRGRWAPQPIRTLPREKAVKPFFREFRPPGEGLSSLFSRIRPGRFPGKKAVKSFLQPAWPGDEAPAAQRRWRAQSGLVGMNIAPCGLI
jgi:hypothetical protein